LAESRRFEAENLAASLKAGPRLSGLSLHCALTTLATRLQQWWGGRRGEQAKNQNMPRPCDFDQSEDLFTPSVLNLELFPARRHVTPVAAVTEVAVVGV